MHFAQPRFEGASQFAIESLVFQRQHPIGFVVRQGPDDGTASVRERQEGERAARQKPLPCGLFMRLLGFDESHHAALLIIVRRHLQARQLAQRGIGAVGGDGELRFHTRPVVQPQTHAASLPELVEESCSIDSTRAGQCNRTPAAGSAAHRRSASRLFSTIQPNWSRPSMSASNDSSPPPDASHTRMRR